ncbi:hypothetical protein ACFL3Y_01635 [Pseudomonadota bacterium]
MKQLLRVLLLVSITAIMTGCKLAVIVVEGGEVQSTGAGTCVAGLICIVDVTDPNFSETFTAIPNDGWYFEKWNAGDGFLCAGSTDRTCTLSFQGHEDSKAVERMVASSEFFYLMPIFTQYPAMITVDGKQWYQPYLFTGLSWEDIDAICPDGICKGMLKGYDLTGWSWASVKDMNDLFNYYIGSDQLGPGPDHANLIYFTESAHVPPNQPFPIQIRDEPIPLIGDGWYLTRTLGYGYVSSIIGGWTKDALNKNPDLAFAASWSRVVDFYFQELVSTNKKTDKVDGQVFPNFVGGAWFYRVP